MSVAGEPRISPGQFFWLVAAGMVTGGVFLWPMPLLLSSGADWPWALLAGGATMALVMALQMAWGRRVPGAAMGDRLRALWGPLALLWLTGSTALSVTVASVFLAFFVHMLQVFYFPSTPAWPLSVLLTGVACVLALQSVDILARNVRVWFVLGLMGFLLLLAHTVTQAPMASALRPPWPPTFLGVLGGVQGTWLFWSDEGATLTLASFTDAAGWSRALRWSFAAAAFQLAVLVMAAANTIAALGPWAARTQLWPMLILMVGAGPTSLSFVRPSLIVLPVWTAGFFSYLAVRLYVASLNTRMATGATPAARRWHTLFLAALVVTLAWCLPSAPELTRLMVDDLGPIALGWALSLHVLSYILSLLRPGLRAQAVEAG